MCCNEKLIKPTSKTVIGLNYKYPNTLSKLAFFLNRHLTFETSCAVALFMELNVGIRRYIPYFYNSAILSFIECLCE